MTDNEHIKTLVTSVFSLKRFLYNKNGKMYISMHALPKLLFFLRDDKRCKMSLIDMYSEIISENVSEISYSLKNREMNTKFNISIEIKDRCLSVADIYPLAAALECEIYDMDGILFSNNDELQRSITDPKTITGHPSHNDFCFYGTVMPFYNKTTGKIDICKKSEEDNDIERL